MELNKFIEKFAEILDDTDASTLTPDTKFRELDEWDSLAALSTISTIDDEFGVTINNKDLRSVETVGELYDMVMSRH